MYKRFIKIPCACIIFHFTLLISCCSAQELIDPLNLLKQNILDVTIKDVVYKQTLQGKNGSCFVSVTIINSEKHEEEKFEFNLSDLNEYKTDLYAGKQSLTIECVTKGAKKVIRVYENGRIKKYTDKFEFYAKDVENGKQIVKELHSQIKLCSENQNNLASIIGNTPDLNSTVQFLTTNIKEVAVNDIVVDQSFSVNEDFNALCTFNITKKEDKKNIKYHFNISDINLSTIDFETKNEYVYVVGKTKGNSKLIEVFENGEKDNFTNKFEFYVEDIEEGRKFKNVLEFYVKEAEKIKSDEIKKLENLNSLEELNEYFKTKLKNEAINDISYSQSFSYNNQKAYLCTFNVINENKGDTESSFVNLVDLNYNNISFSTSGSGVKIEMGTNGKLNLARISQNGEPGKYTNKIVLWSSGIENARVLVETLNKMISTTNKIFKANFIEGVNNPNKEQCIGYLKESFTKVVEGDDAFNLELIADTENSCKLIYKEEDVTKGKIHEYKFDMNDINIHKINFNSRGQEATVYLETKGEKKYIEIIEQGVSKGYNYKVDLKVQDIENARLVSEALKHLSSFCAENLK